MKLLSTNWMTEIRTTFSAKIDENQLCGPKWTNTNFSGQNRPFFSSKSTQTNFAGQNQPKPVFPSQNSPNFLAKISHNQFFRSKLATRFSGRNWPKSGFWPKNGPRPTFPAEKQPKPFLFRPKSARTSFSVKSRPETAFTANLKQN